MMRRRRGFTLIELSAALAILALMAVAAVPVLRTEIKRDKERELRAALVEIREALDAYKRATDEGRIPKSPEESGYPPSLEILALGIPDAKSTTGAKLYFLRRIPRDPFADPSIPAARTWALRSYASPPDAPAPGKDVFDVASQSFELGLNGISYRRW
jgi:general secretion pathway protein G